MRVCELIEEILRLDGAAEIEWMLETHDTWIDPDHCSLLLERVSTPAFGILWDIGHTARIGNSSHEEIFKKIASRTVYTHVKDAILNPAHPQAMKDGWRCCSWKRIVAIKRCYRIVKIKRLSGMDNV